MVALASDPEKHGALIFIKFLKIEFSQMYLISKR